MTSRRNNASPCASVHRHREYGEPFPHASDACILPRGLCTFTDEHVHHQRKRVDGRIDAYFAVFMQGKLGEKRKDEQKITREILPSVYMIFIM